MVLRKGVLRVKWSAKGFAEVEAMLLPKRGAVSTLTALLSEDGRRNCSLRGF